MKPGLTMVFKLIKLKRMINTVNNLEKIKQRSG